jgi:hypothetical protein
MVLLIMVNNVTLKVILTVTMIVPESHLFVEMDKLIQVRVVTLEPETPTLQELVVVLTVLFPSVEMELLTEEP